MFALPFNRLWVCLVVTQVLLLSSCSFFQHTEYKQITKSPNDKKNYQYLVLSNGLKVLLISDEDAQVASASMDVLTGSNNDPIDRQGLAHLVEHMVFLGTKKYPDASSYDEFIKSHGGSKNAFTSAMHTNYFFDVRSGSLEEGLDRFSQFFISPLFDQHYVEREIQAVNAEFKSKIKDDRRRQQDVLKSLVNDQHPWHKFAVGNADTLSGKKGILKALKTFYRQYYSAKNMALVISGRESLSDLQVMAERYFGAIPSYKVKKPEVNQPLFKPGYLPRWVNIQPQKNVKELTLLFPTPDFSNAYKSKPLMLIGHILGHEGRGSLYEYLKRKNWIESLVAGEALAYDDGSAFSLSMNLTNEGLNHQQEIVAAVFQAIERLNVEGIPQWVFNELSEINQLRFIYPIDYSAVSQAISLSHAMHYFPPEDLLEANAILTEYKPHVIKEALSYLTVSNVLVSVMAYGFTYIEHTQFYQVPYTVSKFPDSLKGQINNQGENPFIVMPEPNDLLPGAMTIPKVTSDQLAPKRIIHEEALDVWHKPVVNFSSPRASRYFGFQKYQDIDDIESDVALSLYVALINDYLEDLVYPAYLAGLDFRVFSSTKGITLNIEGFSSRQEDLLEQIVHRIEGAKFESTQFDRVKDEAVRRIGNLKFEQPYRRLLNAWQQEMRPQLWPYDDILEVLKPMDLKTVLNNASRFWKGAGLTVLASGDITEKKAIASSRLLQSRLQKKGDFSQKSGVEVVKLDSPTYKYIQTPYEDYGYLYYWQAENNAISTQVNWIILGKFMESGYFHTLRTEQQLGYVVFANYSPLLTVPGIIFVVQSPKANVSQIHHSTENFLEGVFAKVPDLSETLFENFRLALIEQLSEKPKNLLQETRGYWNDLALGFPFNRKQNLVAAMEKIDFTTWKKNMLDSYQSLPQRSLLLGTQESSDVEPDLKSFKGKGAYKDRYIYPRQ